MHDILWSCRKIKNLKIVIDSDVGNRRIPREKKTKTKNNLLLIGIQCPFFHQNKYIVNCI